MRCFATRGVGDGLYISCGRGDAEFVVALDIKNDGAVKEVWAAKIGPLTVRVIDVMTFDEDGKFTSMKAYFAPDDMLSA